jgi:ligand-binding sensor domain-containing protein
MRKVLAGITVGLILAVTAVVCLQLRRIDTRLITLRHQVATSGDHSFTLRTLDTTLSANTAFEPIAAPNRYTSGASFDRKLYLAGPGGIAIYTPSGLLPPVQTALLRTGIELPPATITALTTGHLHGGTSTTLIAATHGEGILFFNTGTSTNIRQLHPASAIDADITAVLALSSGDLLIGTRRSGVLLYNGATLRPFNSAIAATDITSLAGDVGDLWIGTRTQGLLYWHAGSLSSFSSADGMPDAQINSLTLGPHGELFAATPLGVAEIINGKLNRVLTRGLFATNLAVEGDTLLIATVDQGLHTVPIGNRNPTSLLAPITAPHADTTDTAHPITSFFTSGPQLFALADGALLLRGHAAWQTVVAATPQALADRNVSALSLSPDGHLWIGYFDRGLDVLDLATNRARHLEDDRIFCINRIVPDPLRGTMDVATVNGLVLFDPATGRPRQVLTHRDGLIADQVTDIAFTRSGMTLATPAGLTFFTASGAQSLYAFQGLVNNHVYTLAAQPLSERILAGTLGGISILDNQTVLQNITLKNSALHRNWITAITRVDLPNQPQTWFVGTYGGGIVQMDAVGHISPMQSPATTAVINPNAILATSQHVFAGSLSDGLLVYNIATQHWTQMTTGLPSRSITAFAYRDGTLYIGTDNGVVRIAEARLP